MLTIAQRLWDKTIQPALQTAGLDIRRHPPTPQPDWTEYAFAKLLLQRREGSSSKLSEVERFTMYCATHAHESHSQLFQDLFVRWRLGDRRRGYFVEFGATDGVQLSNSKYLEDALEWDGLLAEPARIWHERLHRNRNCAIDTRCVWTTSGEMLRFNEVSVAELSTLEHLPDKDRHSAERQDCTVYDVLTISLNDLLAEHAAPTTIDYLSIDTEGSELKILERLDFKKYRFNVITIEHNYTPDRDLILNLLSANGYNRVFPQLSKWDDWYVSNDLPSS